MNQAEVINALRTPVDRRTAIKAGAVAAFSLLLPERNVVFAQTSPVVTPEMVRNDGWVQYTSHTAHYEDYRRSDMVPNSIPAPKEIDLPNGTDVDEIACNDNHSPLEIPTTIMIYPKPITQKANSAREKDDRLWNVVSSRVNELTQRQLRLPNPQVTNALGNPLPDKENTDAYLLTTHVASPSDPNLLIPFYSLMFERGGYTWFFDAKIADANKNKDLGDTLKMAALLQVTQPRNIS